MFTALGPTPVMLTTATEPAVVHARWLRPRPPVPVRGERLELAPGVWIIREPQWMPVSTLDVGALVPYPEAEPTRRSFPFPAWHQAALCRSLPLDAAERDRMFFGEEGIVEPETLIESCDRARAVCAVCPVARTCLSWALEHDERYGVWGGTSGKQRQKLRQRLKQGASVEDLVDECLER